MPAHETILSKQEKKWISERRATRLTDNKEVQIYPMGAEKYLSSVLFKNKKNRYNIKSEIEGKDVLIIPGHGNSGFLFAHAGAKKVTIYDKDPVTIAWIKAFKKYYHYREQGTEKDNRYPSIGEILTALTRWYPPRLTLPFGQYRHILFWAVHPNALRQVYIHYMVSLVQQAINAKLQDNFELEKNIHFHTGTVTTILANKNNPRFDTLFVPYLLGVKNGIEQEKDIIGFITQLLQLAPSGHLLITPSKGTKQFYIMGKRYFLTTQHSTIQAVPDLRAYFLKEDKYWFHTQGLTVFKNKENHSQC